MGDVMRLTILRHAPIIGDGRVVGRRDLPADCTGAGALAPHLPRGAQVLVSPALRCRQTAAALSLTPDRAEPALWEQDLGAWQGLPFDRLPDLGPLPPQALARHRPEGAESFDDMAARVVPLLRGLDRDTLIVAHAGTVRAALSMVVGPAALAFSVDPLSMTVLRRAGSDWAVEATNITLGAA
ncbi:histidine phosphatase family protein [Paracoccus aestuarii]|nr:histidine phosphatase family protein [Paracoccus aestuarii]